MWPWWFVVGVLFGSLLGNVIGNWLYQRLFVRPRIRYSIPEAAAYATFDVSVSPDQVAGSFEECRQGTGIVTVLGEKLCRRKRGHDGDHSSERGAA
jgi:hypothetical protein